jgi:hypothetical protein
LSGIRQEKQLQSVYVALQDKQIRGAITFDEACDDLHHRCEAVRADELLATSVRDAPKTLISTQLKRRNKGRAKEGEEVEQAPCLEKDCHETVKKYLPLCGLHYHQCVSGKSPEVELKDGLGKAKYNLKTQVIDYPSTVPKERLPVPGIQRPRKGMMSALRPVNLRQDSTQNFPLDEPMGIGIDDATDRAMKLLAHKPKPTTTLFYVDSGAGQCLSSCSAAFFSLEPCQLEVIGVAGSLPIFGIGTAYFALVLKGGMEIVLRVHNCLYSFGEFNLLSVSQIQTNRRNSLDLSLASPSLRLFSDIDSEADRIRTKAPRFVDIPLDMDDGLYALTMEPLSSDDPRHLSKPIFDVTPPGEYFPISSRVSTTRRMWTTVVLPTPPPVGRIAVLVGTLDFHSELSSFSDSFLAPAGLPPSRRQFELGFQMVCLILPRRHMHESLL